MMMMFVYLVAKDSSSALVLKLTLHSLVSCWEPDLKFITDDHVLHNNTDACTAPCTRPSVIQLIGTDSELSFSSVTFSLILFNRSAFLWSPQDSHGHGHKSFRRNSVLITGWILLTT